MGNSTVPGYVNKNNQQNLGGTGQRPAALCYDVFELWVFHTKPMEPIYGRENVRSVKVVDLRPYIIKSLGERVVVLTFSTTTLSLPMHHVMYFYEI